MNEKIDLLVIGGTLSQFRYWCDANNISTNHVIRVTREEHYRSRRGYEYTVIGEFQGLEKFLHYAKQAGITRMDEHIAYLEPTETGMDFAKLELEERPKPEFIVQQFDGDDLNRFREYIEDAMNSRNEHMFRQYLQGEFIVEPEDKPPKRPPDRRPEPTRFWEDDEFDDDIPF